MTKEQLIKQVQKRIEMHKMSQIQTANADQMDLSDRHEVRKIEAEGILKMIESLDEEIGGK